uniref:Uncharacterized protein n=1 Tax=Ixodes scapularis TaxID=6945 RepID=A0A4D5RDR0_IXOSC
MLIWTWRCSWPTIASSTTRAKSVVVPLARSSMRTSTTPSWPSLWNWPRRGFSETRSTRRPCRVRRCPRNRWNKS